MREPKSLNDILVIARSEDKVCLNGINICKIIEDYHKLSTAKDKNDNYKYSREYCTQEVYKKYLKGEYKK